MPLDASRYLVVVWPEEPAPGVEPVAFVAQGNDVIVYNPGVWHHGIVALDRQTVFTSLFWRPDRRAARHDLPAARGTDRGRAAGRGGLTFAAG